VDGTLLGPGQPDPLPIDHAAWANAASTVGGITPFEAKALYGAGLLRHLLEGSGRCLEKPPFHLSAFVIATEAAEALGRFLTGDARDSSGSVQRLQVGLRSAMGPSGTIKTPYASFNVAACVALRHFATHGGTTPRRTDVIGPELINALIGGLADSLERFWIDLEDSDCVRQQLAKALLRPLFTSGRPLFIPGMKQHFGNGGRPGRSLMYEATWRC
jgi:hypothetical protein